MRFTDKFIQRPVMAFAISLLILILGLHAVSTISVREYPEMTNTTITVSTNYFGASANVVQGFVTQPIQQAIAEADNIDYMDSVSALGRSTVKATMKIDTDPNDALAQIIAKVNGVKSRLPEGVEDPEITSTTGNSISLMYIDFFSESLDLSQVGDYLTRHVQSRLVTIPGIGNAKVRSPALSMRVWLEPVKLAKFSLAASDVTAALRRNNFRSAAGQFKNRDKVFDIEINTDLTSIEEFEQLIIARTEQGVIRLRDIARVELSKVRERVKGRYNQVPTAFISVEAAPDANPLDVTRAVRDMLPDIKKNLPSEIDMHLGYDASVYIESAISEVMQTILEATAIVVLVIFLFLGNLRAMLIPVVAIPFSLIGVCLFMDMLGFSLNLLTLLAMVLSIGLVVDDAIVVVENVERHLSEGKSPFDAAIIGTREIAWPVVVITLVLAAVFTPIALLEGLTGSLFKEFALTLAGAVMVSGVVALTLSPVMCSGFLKPSKGAGRFEQWVNRCHQNMDQRYSRWLDKTLERRPAILLFTVFVLISLPLLFMALPSELAPEEDKGYMILISDAPSNVNLDFMDQHMLEFSRQANAQEGVSNFIGLTGLTKSTQALAVVVAKPWHEREQTQKEMVAALQASTSNVAGMSSSIFPASALPGSGGGMPVQFVLKSASDVETMHRVAVDLRQAIMASGQFIVSQIDTQFDAAKVYVRVNRDKAGAYGVAMKDIGDTLSAFMGDGRINYMQNTGYSYDVVPQVERLNRLSPEILDTYYVRGSSGAMIPLSSLVDVEITGSTRELLQMDQSNAITISAVPMPFVAIGDAVAVFEEKADEILPAGFSRDYKGQSRQYIQEGKALYVSFGLALCIVFLVLAMQFESWRDPLVIMVTVPLAISGALVVMAWGTASLNIYTQVGLLTLVGLITKHGILMCEVAKVQQLEHGLNKMEAIRFAARRRLRAILMTTISMAAGVIPLMLASGAGAAARFNMGVVIFAGLTIGTIFTLFILPTIYSYIGSQHKPLQRMDETVALNTAKE
jgi:multidrug efflux pump